MRMTEIAAGGRPLESAKMVSVIASGVVSDDGRNMASALVEHLARDPQDHQQSAPGDPAIAVNVARDDVCRRAHQQDREDEPEDQDKRMLAGCPGHPEN